MRKYLDENVLEAAEKRIAYLFDSFECVLVSFSGGKDSGVCLNLCYDYAVEHDLTDKLVMYHLDYEAQYQATTNHVTEVFEQYPLIDKYWLCLPIEAQCACRMDGAFWTPWAPEAKDIWCRQMPDSPHLISEDNAPFEIKRGLTDKEMQDRFAEWIRDTRGETAVVIGIRTQESLDRTKLITAMQGSIRKHEGMCWLTDDKREGMHRAYPIYDWQTEDVWTYFGKTGHSYNKLYDLYYQAGLGVNDMRVASPFNNCAMTTLKLYKVIDPDSWGKMVGRVNGANFGSIYGSTTAMGWRGIKLPPGHTWKSYCYFLLSTLDDDLRTHYEKILATSIEFWCEKGGFVSQEVADDIKGYQGVDNLGPAERYENQLVYRFHQYPDEFDCKSFPKLPSYKRMCVCILKNDYYCTYMGFGKTKEAAEKRRKAIEKYKELF